MGSRAFHAAETRLEETWQNATKTLPRWGIIRPNGMTAVSEALSPILDSRSQQRAVVSELAQHTRDAIDTVRRRFFIPYTKTPWYEFREQYDLLTEAEAWLFDEAFRAHMAECYRAAIILVWGAATYHLREYIEQRMSLPQFNSSSAGLVNAQGSFIYKRFNKQQIADTRAELDNVPDAHIMATLLYAGILTSEQYEILDECRTRRNRCAHPGITGAVKWESLFHSKHILQVVFENPKFR